MVEDTSRSRVMAAIDLSIPDRVPVVPQITYTTAQLTGIDFRDAATNSSLMAEALYQGYRRFGYDGVYAGWEASFNIMAEAMGCRLRTLSDDISTIAEGIVKEAEDIDRLKPPDPEKDGRLPIYLRVVDLLKDKLGEEAPIFSYIPGPLTLSGLLYEMDNLMLDMIANPEMIHRLNEVTVEASKRFADAKIRHGVDIVVLADPTASTSLISPEMFKNFAMPYIKEVMETIREAGAIPSLHICGKTSPILELMVETGAKILEVDNIVDLRDAKEKVGRRVCLMGNVNTTLLLTGDPSRVEAEAKACIEAAAMEGGFILSSGCEVPLRAPLENVEAMVRAAKKYGIYRE